VYTAVYGIAPKVKQTVYTLAVHSKATGGADHLQTEHQVLLPLASNLGIRQFVIPVLTEFQRPNFQHLVEKEVLL
jgi:hypothetical protein